MNNTEPSEPTERVTLEGHPTWCDPELCTAKPGEPYTRAVDAGYHRSALSPVDGRIGFRSGLPDNGKTTFQLRRIAAPWLTSTSVYLQVAGVDVVDFNAGDLGPLLELLGAAEKSLAAELNRLTDQRMRQAGTTK